MACKLKLFPAIMDSLSLIHPIIISTYIVISQKIPLFLTIGLPFCLVQKKNLLSSITSYIYKVHLIYFILYSELGQFVSLFQASEITFHATFCFNSADLFFMVSTISTIQIKCHWGVLLSLGSNPQARFDAVARGMSI